MILGIDIGNSNTKSSKGVIFESKVSKVATLNNFNEMVWNGTKYFLGDGEFDTTYRKIDKTNYMELLLGSIALSTTERINDIVLGLPLSQYKADKETLKLNVMSNRDNFIEIDGVERHICINDIEVVPEGIFTVDKDFEGVIVDIGGGTTDCCLLENINGKRKIQNPYSDPIGIQKLYSNYVKVINSRYGLDLVPNDADRILKKGLKIDGEQVETRFAINVFKDFTERLVSRLQREYSLRTYDIALVGGGAKVLFKPIKSRIKNCNLIDDYLFGNALAYEEYGKGIWE